jgi:hypothetical protein
MVIFINVLSANISGGFAGKTQELRVTIQAGADYCNSNASPIEIISSVVM